MASCTPLSIRYESGAARWCPGLLPITTPLRATQASLTASELRGVVDLLLSSSTEEQRRLVVDGLRRLVDIARPHGVNVIVENHGGLSSNGKWLAQVITSVGQENCGTLPDFGNFNLGDGKSYDRYKGVRELMPFAKAVSAKSTIFIILK